MGVYRTAISEIGSAPHQQGSQFLVFQCEGGRQYGSETHILRRCTMKFAPI
jgi:hypothetical protein